ncbi:MAG: hypothetical protein QM820_29500 [Minicystis sp.]
MSGRVQSREDLFLSAVDMYTLLSFCFIGLAFVASPVAGPVATVDLPVFHADAHGKSTANMLVVQWSRGSAPKPGAGSLDGCRIDVQPPPGVRLPATKDVPAPCGPIAFGRAAEPRLPAQIAAFAALWDEKRLPREALVQCDTKHGFEACSALQWVISEAGFRTGAVVSDGTSP